MASQYSQAEALRFYNDRIAADPRGMAGTPKPGDPGFDTWVVDWFTNSVNAADPAALKIAGIGTSEGGQAGDIITRWENAAPSSEWLGKRNPSPAELRRYARDAGWSEDFARFPDRQLAAWINDSWNPAGYFVNDFGDRVEKPTESGPNSTAAGFATGEGPQHGGRGAGGGGGGGGGGAASAPGMQNYGAYGALENPLQQKLYELYGSRGGYFGEQGQNDTTRGTSLQGGGIWWNDPGNAPAGGNAPAAVAPQTGGISPAPAAGGGRNRGNVGTSEAANAWNQYGAATAKPITSGQVTGGQVTLPQPIQGPLETALQQGPYGGGRRTANDWWMPQRA